MPAATPANPTETPIPTEGADTELDDLLGVEEPEPEDAPETDPEPAPAEPEPEDATVEASPEAPAQEAEGAPSGEEPEGSEATSEEDDSPEAELAAIKEQMRLDRIARDEERRSMRAEIAKLRADRRELRSQPDPAAPAPEEAAGDAIIPTEWNDEGTAGTPRAAVQEIVNQSLDAREQASQASDPGEPELTPYQRWQQEQYTTMRSNFLSENPTAEPLVTEYEQGFQWLDQEIGATMQQTGWTNPAGDRNYLRDFLTRSGIVQRFSDRFPRAAKRDILEFMDTALSGDMGRISDYMKGGLDEAHVPATPQTPVERVPDHPSHVGRGRGAKTDASESKRARYKELAAKNELTMSDAEWEEFEALEVLLLDQGDGGPATGKQLLPDAEKG